MFRQVMQTDPIEIKHDMTFGNTTVWEHHIISMWKPTNVETCPLWKLSIPITLQILPLPSTQNSLTRRYCSVDSNFSYATNLTSDLEATGKAWEPLDNNKNGIHLNKHCRGTFGTYSHA